MYKVLKWIASAYNSEHNPSEIRSSTSDYLIPLITPAQTSLGAVRLNIRGKKKHEKRKNLIQFVKTDRPTKALHLE